MQQDVKHGGNLAALTSQAQCRTSEILDLSVNLNPLGPPSGAFECYFKSYELLNRYPEPRATSLTELLARLWQRTPQEIMTGNGSNELLHLLPLALRPKRAVIVTPGYQEYAQACVVANVPVTYHMLHAADDFTLDFDKLAAALQPDDMIMLGSPNNPTGRLTDKVRLRELSAARPDCTFVLDEAFIDFAGAEFSLMGTAPPNLIISRSFTKFYALPGLRMGALAGPAAALDKVRALQGIWTMSVPALAMAKFLLSQSETYSNESIAHTKSLREGLAVRLQKLGNVKVYHADANYLLVETSREDLPQALLMRHKIAVRDCRDYPGLNARHVRIAVCAEEQQRRLLSALEEVLGHKSGRYQKPKSTPALMIQGTCSNAGKSVLTAAFCRILLQDGLSVAPFKAQNMALNSYVTHDGLEIGRAQAFQAEACRLNADVRMNPVLLKPNSNTDSQVILRGRPVGNFGGREYYRNKALFWETVKECYDSLAADHGVIVLEGAGSPAEINLKQSDIVNMNMAAYAKAHVLLAGDIDRGGVFAAFAGTYATLTLAERTLLAGFVVNKFRGDASLLSDAHRYIEDLTGKPVLGVLDYLPGLHLPEEDSVSHGLLYELPKQGQVLNTALIMLPHIANFTDFDPLLLEPDISIRKVRDVRTLGAPDIVILPGTKNTVADLAWLRQQGLDSAIRELYAQGAWLIGICGGLQMLGVKVRDPRELESNMGEMAGLGLLPLETVLESEKTLCQSRAVRVKDGAELRGYEIHHGRSTCHDASGLHLQVKTDGSAIGYETKCLFGSYLHGVFDDDNFRRRFINEMRAAKGWQPLEGVTAVYDNEESLNRLAAHVRERINMGYIYKLLGL